MTQPRTHTWPHPCYLFYLSPISLSLDRSTCTFLILMLHVHCHLERSHCQHNNPHHPVTNSLNKSLHQNDTQGHRSWRFQMNAMATFLLKREKSAFFPIFFFLFCLFFFKPPSSFSLTCLPPLSRKWEQEKIKGGIKNAIANKYSEISHCTASL